MLRIECSVWSNGTNGFGLRVLGGITTRSQYFDRSKSPVLIDLDGELVQFNVNKSSFWSGNCGELIGSRLRPWFQKNHLQTGDHVWLEILESNVRFRLTL